jgi:hypothetical protein
VIATRREVKRTGGAEDKAAIDASRKGADSSLSVIVVAPTMNAFWRQRARVIRTRGDHLV